MNTHTHVVECPAGFGGEYDEQLFMEVEPEKEQCSCCGLMAFPIHRPIAFKAGNYTNVWLCELCFEEFESGNNPLYKPKREDSL